MDTPVVLCPIPSLSPIKTDFIGQQLRPGRQLSPTRQSSNVERLERSAERLSLGPSDLGEEIRKIWQEEKLRDMNNTSSLIYTHPLPTSTSPLRETSAASASQSVAHINKFTRGGGHSPHSNVATPSSPASVHSVPSSTSLRNVTRTPKTTTSAVNSPRVAPLEGVLLATAISTHVEEEDRNISLRLSPATSSIFEDCIKSTGLRDLTGSKGNIPQTSRTYAASPNLVETATSANVSSLSLASSLSQSIRKSPSSVSSTQASSTTQEKSGSTSDPRKSDRTGRFDQGRVALGYHNDTASMTSKSSESSKTSAKSADSRRSHVSSMKRSVTAENMVYYPAPVPMRLRLPKRLSSNPSPTSPSQRQSQALNLSPHTTPNTNSLVSSARRDVKPQITVTEDTLLGAKDPCIGSTQQNDLQPHLGAGDFFNEPTIIQHFLIKQGSAVATLDSLLDASIVAPVAGLTKQQRPAPRIPLALLSQSRDCTAMDLSLISDSLTDVTQKRTSMLPNNSKLSGGGRSRTQAKKRMSMFELATANAADHSSENQIKSAVFPTETAQWAEELWDSSATSQPLPPKTFEPGMTNYECEIEVMRSTLLTELEARRNQQRQSVQSAQNQDHNQDDIQATLLELDAIAQMAHKQRQTKGTAPVPAKTAMNVSTTPTARPSSSIQQRDLGKSEPLSKMHDRIEVRSLAGLETSFAAPRQAHDHLTMDTNILVQRVRRSEQSQPSTESIFNSPSTKTQEDLSAEILHGLGVPAQPVPPNGLSSSPTIAQSYVQFQSSSLPTESSPVLPSLSFTTTTSRLNPVEAVTQRRIPLQHRHTTSSISNSAGAVAKPLPALPQVDNSEHGSTGIQNPTQRPHDRASAGPKGPRMQRATSSTALDSSNPATVAIPAAVHSSNTSIPRTRPDALVGRRLNNHASFYTT